MTSKFEKSRMNHVQTIRIKINWIHSIESTVIHTLGI